ncbi:hypothetical protein FGG08_002381 [Glutinoglossum americanum]|uniref:Transcriptional regulator n=1 Tax=Glutinoglossum americanum TaxID=1670608 RepID=A0A9P8I9D9_9PEZI|nr:hypothetical protein FGG08_002381 [Glutinoglossum americanum]
MSDSELSSLSSSPSTPSNATLATTLCNVAKRIFNSDLSNLTVKRVRSAAEEQLKLAEGFFREHPEWRGKSKEIVKAEADALFAAKEAGNENLSSPPSKKPVSIKKGATVKAKATPSKSPKADGAKRGTKRSSPVAEPRVKKRQKKDVVTSSGLEEQPANDSGGEVPKKKSPVTKPSKRREGGGRGPNIKQKRQIVDEEDEEDEDVPKKGGDRRDRAKAQSDSEGNDVGTAKTLPTAKPHGKGPSNIDNEDSGLSITTPAQDSSRRDGTAGNASESEMSIVIDEEPAPKRKKKRPSDTASSKKAKPSKTKSSTAAPKDDGTPEAEIKRLQSWLLKCGIRKVWSRELAPYSTPKSKITHLKQMLKDVGMGGRFSTEKARQIKEGRELKAELEAVQDGARRWGEGAVEEDEETSPKPRRRLARGLRELDFLGSDGEETE